MISLSLDSRINYYVSSLGEHSLIGLVLFVVEIVLASSKSSFLWLQVRSLIYLLILAYSC